MHKFASPANFTRLSRYVLPVAVALALLCGAAGLYLGLFVAPDDYQQGAMVKVMYIHVPAAIMASMIYGFIAVMSASFLIWRHTMADVLAREAAAIGAVFTLVCLVTGMLWGKPTWGAYWVWDARLTSMLILLLLYVGYMGIANAGDHSERVKVASAWIALIGAINLPIIKYSVEWWNSLHQGQSLSLIGTSSIAPAMLHPLQLMIVSFAALFVALLLVRANAALKEVKLRRLQIQRVALKNAAIEIN